MTSVVLALLWWITGTISVAIFHLYIQKYCKWSDVVVYLLIGFIGPVMIPSFLLIAFWTWLEDRPRFSGIAFDFRKKEDKD